MFRALLINHNFDYDEHRQDPLLRQLMISAVQQSLEEEGNLLTPPAYRSSLISISICVSVTLITIIIYVTTITIVINVIINNILNHHRGQKKSKLPTKHCQRHNGPRVLPL